MPSLKTGAVIEGYALIGEAPLDFIRGSRTREIDGHCVTGSWSEPWWAYNPVTQVYVVVKRWKSREYTYFHPEKGAIAARDEVIIEACSRSVNCPH